MAVTVALALDDLPMELQEKLVLQAPPEHLSDLLNASPRLRLIWRTSLRLRKGWLQLHTQEGLASTTDLCGQDAHLLMLAHQVDPEWALHMYQSTTLRRRVCLVERLLQDQCSWPLATRLAHYERQQDALMKDPSYGIYTRHLAWRFSLHQCPI